MDTAELKAVACKAIDDAAEDLNLVSKELWTHPELALKEHYAHDVLTEFMEKYTFPNIKKHLHLETAFSASYGEQGNGPHIMVMSEYDALPDIGHACGHNLIAEVGIATGVGIKAAMEKSKCGIGKVLLRLLNYKIKSAHIQNNIYSNTHTHSKTQAQSLSHIQLYVHINKDTLKTQSNVVNLDNFV